MPETERYTKYSSLAKKPLTFTATYIRNGMSKGSCQPTMLLTNVCLAGNLILDHVWVTTTHNYHIRLRSKQNRSITFIGKLVKLTKLKQQAVVTKDLGITIEELL